MRLTTVPEKPAGGDRLRDAKRLSRRLGLGLAVLVGLLIVLLVTGNTFIRGSAVGALVLLGAMAAGWTLVVLKKAKAGVGPTLEPPIIPDGPWDYSMAAHDLEGRRIAFSDFAGAVLVLSFWRTWHGPSMRQMRGLERLRDATHDLGVRFACVTRDSDAAVRKFLDLRSGKLSLPLYVLDDAAPQPFERRTMPATVILDRAGTVALAHVGPAAWDDESVVTFVRRLAESV